MLWAFKENIKKHLNDTEKLFDVTAREKAFGNSMFHTTTKIQSRLQRKQAAKIHISLRTFAKDSNNMLYKHLYTS